jgi:hypothetical protein
MNVRKFIKKRAFSSYILPKIKFFRVYALHYYIFRFTAHIQSKTSQLAQYDIVEMFTQNLVEVGYGGPNQENKNYFQLYQKKLNSKVASGP